MLADLCRGWTESDILAALDGATDLQQAVLRAIARNPGATAIDVAAEIGAPNWRTVAGALSSWYQNTTRPMGIKDPATGEDSWPFHPERVADSGRELYRYLMPAAVTAVVLRATDDAVNAEFEHRRALWAQLLADGGTKDISPRRIRELGIYGGAQGIWVDKARTSAVTSDGRGITVSVLHTGATYADDLYDGGILYHYPQTGRPPGRDAAEVEATKAARELGLPVFVISSPSPRATTRNVDLAWVEAWDDTERLFLLTFAPEQPVDVLDGDDEAQFELQQRRTARTATVHVRQGRHRFKFLVFARYGARCAVCDVSIARLLDAAHIRGYRADGSDDPRNGLVLCPLHHRAFDAELFAIDPRTLEIHVRPGGPHAAEMGLTRTTLTHLTRPPHRDALEWRWTRWSHADGAD